MSSPEAREPEAPVSLRELARWAVARGLASERSPEVDPAGFPEWLREPGASFVTLRRGGELRGCTGSLEPYRALACDVVANAWRSAREDPRFAPVEAVELPELEFHVAVLSPLEPLAAASEAELLASLRPGIDGLVLREGERAATFLPAVWASLPEPAEFFAQLCRKAGLPRGHWSGTLRFQRYTARDVD